MSTAIELAAECGVPVEDILTALMDMREFILGPDSEVRDLIADEIRRRIRTNTPTASDARHQDVLTSDAQLEALRVKLLPEKGSDTSMAQIDLTPPAKQRTNRVEKKNVTKKKGWRPGDAPLPTVLRALADQIVRLSFVESRPPGVVFPDELESARKRQKDWVETCFDSGLLLDDEVIANWITTFPERILIPKEILPIVAAGFTPGDVRLRLWYGRLNADRPTLLDQILLQDLQIQKALDQVARYRAASQ